MAVTRNRQGLIIVDLLAERNTAWPQHTEVYCNETAQLMYRSETTVVTTALAGLTMIVEKVA